MMLSNLNNMSVEIYVSPLKGDLLYLPFPICGTVSHKLTWSRYFEILKADDRFESETVQSELNKLFQ